MTNMHFFLYVGVEKNLRLSTLLHGWAKSESSSFSSPATSRKPQVRLQWRIAEECGHDSWDGGLSKGLIRSDCLVPWSVPVSVRSCLSA